MREITGKQAEVLAFIERSVDERGFPPTVREIRQFLLVRGTTTVTDHLRALERKGAIRRTPGCARGIVVVSRSPPRVAGMVHVEVRDVRAPFGALVATMRIDPKLLGLA